MYDVKVLHLLDKIIESVEIIQQRTVAIHCVNDFLDSSAGTLLLDSICMKLIAIGESVKNLDKVTTGSLLVHYPQIPWREVMGMRDIIVHHYFEVDADVIFNTIQENIPLLMSSLKQIRKDLSEK
ncbi:MULTISPECIES: DUF86 domain-containing protein [Butyricimonas]|jgi:putative toxin-antitoxin system, antitoxin component|uniref:DUF86 domain-containing protein n=1 Tax=Butyricimonas hominis TaxID=2763032 RepID=A0ABR7D3J1_9BACT|nr:MULTISPECIES: HepT-like ribonuclease domain-containing protein [Butyricimonas]MBC5622538.1 DUF86 domain-containing protein [Butyricimonas hominis]MCB6974063.1 DUF86 domain-containing protein [Butyricimonas synergistica]MCG4520875.1 DUF86 domain-containing protein [Butyricimonas sp. DFI.6.44]